MNKTVLWGCVLLAVTAGCGTRPAPPETVSSDAASPGKDDSHRRMLALLDEIRVDAHARSNKFFAAEEAAMLRTEISALPENAPSMERLRLLSLLGIRELNMGEIEEAIAHVTTAYRMVPALEDQFESYPIRLPLLIGLAYLRKAETENCVMCNTHESCVFPIQNGGIHGRPEGARNAIPYLQAVLDRDAEFLTARWLLNLAYMVLGEYPAGVPREHLLAPELFESEIEFPRFVNVAADLGVNSLNHAGGAIADDFDGNGFLDIVTSNMSPSGQIKYFKNRGDGTFRDATEEAGLTGLFGGLNIVHADYDNDGDLDILVLRGAWLEDKGRYPNSLLNNDGHGHFRDVTFDVGLGDVHYPTQTASWADYDNDGDLDLYIGNEDYPVVNNQGSYIGNQGYPCQLFENDGQGRFRDVAERAGVINGGKAKGVIWGDYDNDGFPDLYVSNQGQDNRLYHNNGNGSFTDVAVTTGVVKPLRSFPTWFWDYNNDGCLDLYAGCYGPATIEHIAGDYLGIPYVGETDRVYRGDGKGGFADVTAELNLARPRAPMGSNFGDLDHDGYPDFYLGTGYPELEQLMPNAMFYNQRGKRFVDVSAAGGFGHLQKGHGVAFADFDHDGDQDVFIEIGGAYAADAFWNAFFKNPGFGNHWIALKLTGTVSNRCAIGAKIRVEIEENGSRRSVHKWVNSGGSFGGNPFRQQIGIGSARQIEVLEVYWPTSGKTDRFVDVPADRFLEITEGASTFRELPYKTIPFPNPTST